MSLEIIDSLNFKKWFGDWENNPEAASKVVDQNGRPLVVHHGSDSEFNEFSSKFIGQTGTQHGQGFYFTSDKGFAGNFGKKIKSFFLNIRKPLSTDELTLSYNDCVKLIDAIDKRQCEDDPEFGYGILSDYGDVDSYGREKVLKNAAELEYSSADNDVEIVGSLINASGDYDIVVNTLYSLFGYDGIICPERDIFIIHHPNQAKEVSNTLFNNNSNNMYEGKKNRNIFITESQYKQLINESQESKSIDAAKKLLISNGYTPEQADKFIRIDLRNDIPSLRDSKNAKFILGVTRMFLNRELSDATTILNIDKTIKLLALAHYNEYDRNLNGLSAKELINRFADARSEQSQEKRNALSSRQFEQRDYNIVKINSFEEASRYSNYTSWCVTQYEDAFNSYTAGGEAQFYFCLKNGFENKKPIEGENCPLDEYGLSMIAVCVDCDGDLKTCTCRWNHDNGGNDNIMDEEQISNVVGVNFYQVFKPSNILKEKIEALKNMTEIPEDYFCSSKIKEITIPNNITSIGDGAFYKCSNLKSVTIPDSVTKIGEFAFGSCTSLTSVTIPDSVTEIGEYAFLYCDSLTSVTIPDSVTSIGEEAFSHCNSLTSVTIGDSVTSIGEEAFAYCNSLTSVTIPDSVTSIGRCAFGWCISLTSITIPDSVTKIGYGAFAYCTSLTSVTIPNSVTEIGWLAFDYCTSLTSVTIGNSVTLIGENAFRKCTSLTSVTIPIRFKDKISDIFGNTNANFKFYGQQNESLIKKSKRIFVTESQYKRLKEHAELNMLLEDTRTNVAKKQCLHIIRNHFNNASWLDTVFNHNDNPEGLTYIDYMFKQFMSEFYHNPDYRKKATMRLAPLFCRLAFESNFQNDNPDTAKLNRLSGILNFIYQLMEKNKLDVSKISLDLTYEELNNQFGAQIDQMDKDEDERINNAQYTENSEYTVIGPVDFKTANKYGDYSCPISKLCYTQSERTWKSFTSYGENNAYIILKNGWENMEANHDDNSKSAYDTYGLSMIFVFVDGQGKLEYCNTRWNHEAKYAEGFSCDHAMSREMISELIGRPFNEVFKPSNGLKEKIEALKGMTKIPKEYFKNSNMKEIIIPDNITSIGDYAFYNCKNLTSITIPDRVTSIGEWAFCNCTSLTSVTIGDSVTEIGIYAFGDCTSLKSVTIPDSVTSIGYGAFKDCTSLTSVTIPDSVTSIGYAAFGDCTSLTSITIPNGVTKIGNCTFENCTSLKSVTIPDSVTEIEFETFANCTSLTSVTIPDSVTEIGMYLFYGCTSLTNITIPNSVTEIGEGAFGNCTSLKEVIMPIRFKDYIEWIFEETNINIRFYGQQNESLNKNTKKIFITESQLKTLEQLIVEGDNYYVDTTKVKIVKKFLDAQFKRGSMDTMGSDGYPKRINIFAMKGNNGDVVKNLSLEQMVDLLEDKFHHIFTEREKRNRFFKQILKDWYNKKITREGLLSTYMF